MNSESIWQAALGELEVTLSKANFTTWFKDTFILSLDKTKIIIGVPSSFYKEWLQNKYHKEIFLVLKKLVPSIETIDFKIATDQQRQTETPDFLKVETFTPKAVQTQGCLNSRYFFKNFVVANSNKLAHAASLAVAKKPGQAYNPLFIWGGVGLGKTHLLQAMGNEICQNFPDKKLLYVSCDQFTNDFIRAIRRGGADKFKDRYRNVDALLLDDIQFLAGKESTQEEFFHTFNALHQDNKQLVFTSDRPPKSIPTLEERLKSRFEWGLTCDIQPPDFETRKAILQTKAWDRKIRLPDEVTDFIAQNIHQNIRELEGALNKLIAHTELYKLPITVDSTSEALKGLMSPKSKSLSFDKIIEIIAGFYSIGVEDLLGKKRDKEIVLPRQMLMYLGRQELQLSYPQIARNIGKKDHTTVMHGYEKIKKAIRDNQDIQRDINLIKEKLFL